MCVLCTYKFCAMSSEEEPTHKVGARLCRSVVQATHFNGIWAVGRFQACVSEGGREAHACLTNVRYVSGFPVAY